MNNPTETLINLEKATLAAYKRRDAKAFTQSFGRDYVGVAPEGVITADDEIRKMMTMELDELHLEDPKVGYPAEGTAIITYKMITRGKAGGKHMSLTIFTSTVYVLRDARWEAVLHTETMAA